jgi:hypothetical protein
MIERNKCQGKERLWWVRYVYKSDIATGKALETLPMSNVFFYALTEEDARQKVANWQHFTKHDEVLVESLEVAPYGFQFQWRPGLLGMQIPPESQQGEDEK